MGEAGEQRIPEIPVVTLCLLLLTLPQMVLPSCEEKETAVKVLGMHKLNNENTTRTKTKAHTLELCGCHLEAAIYNHLLFLLMEQP